MNVGSLFSGVGLLDCGLHLAEFEHAWFCEADEYRRGILAQRWPGVPVHDDIRTLEGRLPPLSQQHFTEAVALYESGLSLEAVAERFPVTRQALWERMKRAGVVMRPQLRFGEENHFHRGGEVGEDWARNKVEKAIARGELVRPDRCENCGEEGKPYSDGRAPIQAHHDDYNEPLTVRWLCQPCHHDWHKNNKPVPRAGGDAQGTLAEVGSVDLIAGGFPTDPVRASRTLGSGRGSGIPRLRFGERCSDSFASFDPATCSWRTLQPSLLDTTEHSSPRFSQGWPRAGTTRSGIAFRLPPSAPRTAAIASSSPLLPTPQADPRAAYKSEKARRPFAEGGHSSPPGLGQVLESLAMLPTPSAEFTHLPDRETFEARREREKAKGRNGNGFGLTLPMALILLPSPAANDGQRYRIRTASEGYNKPLEQRLVELGSTGSSSSPRSAGGKGLSDELCLSPSFVEWMMGAPDGWSDPDCPLSATEFSSKQAGSPAAG